MTHILKAFASDSFISIAIQKQYKFTGSNTYMSVKAAKSYTIYRKEKAGNGNDG